MSELTALKGREGICRRLGSDKRRRILADERARSRLGAQLLPCTCRPDISRATKQLERRIRRLSIAANKKAAGNLRIGAAVNLDEAVVVIERSH